MHESSRKEYKRELTDNLERVVVSFLNSREGGVVYLGVDDSGEIIGIGDIDSTQLKIKDRLKNNIQPSCMGLFDVISEMQGNHSLIKIILASGSEKPYYLRNYGMTEKGCFIRIGSATEPMPQRTIEQLFAKRTRNALGKIKSNRQDLTFEQLKIFYEAKGLILNDKFATSLELLDADGKYNYVAYLLADSNNTSIKVAKYKGTDRVNLIENNEYGYCSLIKATKAVLDKVNLENRTLTRITARERINSPLWAQIALREAIINAIVHNDYTNEIPPKFEIFDDRIEITSAGSLPDELSTEEFFLGISVPRNKELMRVFKDLDLVEHLGSGVPRILKSYPRESFHFTANFVRMVFPVAIFQSEEPPSDYSFMDNKMLMLIMALDREMTFKEIVASIDPNYNQIHWETTLKHAIDEGFVEETIPRQSNNVNPEHIYSVTAKGSDLLWSLYQATDGQGTEGVKPENDGVKPGNEGVKPGNEGVKSENEGVKSENEGVMPRIEGVSKKVKNEISKLYRLICQHPGRKSSELSTQIGKSIATTERYLKILKENGFIVYKGAPKTGGYYEG